MNASHSLSAQNYSTHTHHICWHRLQHIMSDDAKANIASDERKKFEIIISASANGKEQSIVCAHFIFLSLVPNYFANAHCPLSRTKHPSSHSSRPHPFFCHSLLLEFFFSLLLLFLLLCLFVKLNGKKEEITRRKE